MIIVVIIALLNCSGDHRHDHIELYLYCSKTKAIQLHIIAINKRQFRLLFFQFYFFHFLISSPSRLLLPASTIHNTPLTLATTLDLANYFTFCFIILKNHIKRGNVFLVFVELMMKRPEEAVCHAFSIRLDPFEAVAAAALLDEDINK